MGEGRVMQSPSIMGVKDSRRPSRRFLFSSYVADRFEPALMRNKPFSAECVRGSSAPLFRRDLNGFGHGPRGFEWDI